jgi:nucleotidyltransferase/DNA polymerase involved in DNA repair
MVACVYLPRFELVAAAEGSSVARRAVAGGALAVAPPVSADGAAAAGRLGEVSGAAEARGVIRGMLLGEALARCPDLVLLPGNPVRVGEIWEASLLALESIGAAVEPGRPGLAYFETDGLNGLHGTQEGTIAAARRALGRPARVGVAPARFSALAAALQARSRRALVLEGGEAKRWLAGRPVGLLGYREETAELLDPLRRLGVDTLGELRKLGRAALADRFGRAGSLAHRLAAGEDSPLRPRHPQERLEETMEVGDAGSGDALKRVLGVLVSRLLARTERRGRTLRSVRLSARLVSGGSWHEEVVFREPVSDPQRIWLALSLRLALLPAPADALRLAVERFGPPQGEQGVLLDQDRASRRARLGEAIAQVRIVAGRDAALRAVCVDPDSRVPERRVVLAPVSE